MKLPEIKFGIKLSTQIKMILIETNVIIIRGIFAIEINVEIGLLINNMI